MKGKISEKAMQEAQEMQFMVEAEEREMTHISQDLFGQVKDFVIRTPEQKVKSSELLKQINTKIADFETLEKEAKKPFKDKIDTLTFMFKNPITVLKQGKAKLNQAILDWNEKLENDRRAKEAELKKQQEAEAKKLEAKAAKTKDPEKKAELQATAEAIKAVVPVVASAAVKTDGESMVENWGFEIMDESKVPVDYKMCDEVKIGKVVRATKGSLQIPGVRIYSYKTLRSTKA